MNKKGKQQTAQEETEAGGPADSEPSHIEPPGPINVSQC